MVNDKEYCINGKFYDFTDHTNKIIIEYNGDLFHGNPEKFKPTDCCNPFTKSVTASEMWNRDAIKQSFAREKGYTVFVVWESKKDVGFIQMKGIYENIKSGTV